MTIVLELLAGMIVPLLKWIFGAVAKKKLNDKEFVDYVRAHQKRKGRAGQAALDWEDALAEAQKEMEEETGE